MPSQILIKLIMVATASFLSLAPTTQQNGLASRQAEVVKTILTFFSALEPEDATKFEFVVEPEFYIFEGGSRLDGQSTMTLMKNHHKAGRHYQWRVTEPSVQVDGDTAWLAYVNKGKITAPSGTTEQQWLESAVLKKDKAFWKIVFLHSTRVPDSSTDASHK